MIETALSLSRNTTVLVYARPDFVEMPDPMRAGWLRAIYPAADVRVPESPPLDAEDDETHRQFVGRYLAKQGIKPDVVVSSEAYGPGFAKALGAAHHMVDRARLQAPVSGSAIRAAPGDHLDWLHPLVRQAVRELGDINRRG